MDHRIEHVSDTALLVAASRAAESERPNGLIRDPFAARLAGERGLALLKNTKTPAWIELGMGLRTRLLDELLATALADGVDTVLSLGAGLDARAWRLDLPANLRWIEVDFPAMLDYKFGVLEDATPKCRLERRSADLNDETERRAVIAEAVRGARKALLICEGLLMYLPGDTVHALAEEARGGGISLLAAGLPSRPRCAAARMGTRWIRSDGFAPRGTWRGHRFARPLRQAGSRERRLYMRRLKLALQRILTIIASEGRPMENPPNDGTGVWLFRATLMRWPVGNACSMRVCKPLQLGRK